MASPATKSTTLVLRGGVLSFRDDPFRAGVDASRVFESDGAVAIRDGRIVAAGNARQVIAQVPADAQVACYDHALIAPGFIDCHVHYPQLPIIGAGGKPLLDWLDAYTFPAEQRYVDADFAREVARLYLRENLRNGITTASVFGTVHAHSVDVVFEEAKALGLRLLAGKALMDRNAPAALLDTAQRGYDESKALIERWHGRGRLAYAITPRFAATSTPAQLEAASALWREFPGTYVQSHVAESQAELQWIRTLYPGHRSYLEVYGDYGLLGRRAVYAHALHVDDADLGSGQFDLARARHPARPVNIGLATDLGAGTHFSMLRTMQAASEVAHLRGSPLAPARAWWLATAGAAEALDLSGVVGNLAPGGEADLCVLDLRATPLLAFRMQHVRDIDEALAVLLALGDDRAVRATYVAGSKVWDRDEGTS